MCETVKIMEHLKLEATDVLPEIDFDFQNHVFHIRGESYPEDVTAFFGPISEKLTACLENALDKKIEFNFELIYFNSSSAKVIMSIFDQLEEVAEAGADVTINWRYDADDDTMEELGQEFGDDLETAKFNMTVIDS